VIPTLAATAAKSLLAWWFCLLAADTAERLTRRP
jgi:hypothetical protein